MNSNIFETFLIGAFVFLILKSLTQPVSKEQFIHYLAQYETQDLYQNQPSVWPVVDNQATFHDALARNEL